MEYPQKTDFKVNDKIFFILDNKVTTSKIVKTISEVWQKDSESQKPFIQENLYQVVGTEIILKENQIFSSVEDLIKNSKLVQLSEELPF